MSVLTIRAYKRYATRLPVELRRAGRKPMCGLLIELSQQGARVSNLGRGKLAVGDAVTLVTPDGMTFAAIVRWAHDGLAGLRLEQSLHLPELRGLLDLNRREAAESALRYGT
jgi:hypothetical protein